MGVGRKNRRIRDAVHEAEALTGLQFCVYLGPAEEDARQLAERLFAGAEHDGQRPAVLVAVCPVQHRIEILTAEWAQERIPDDVCREALERMLPALREGRYDDGLVIGIRHLTAAAGGGERGLGIDLPDLFDEHS